MRNLIAPALIFSVLAFPAAAAADPVSDCAEDGSVDGTYTNAQLKKALNNIPGDVAEYSDCKAAIQAAMKSSKSKKGGATAGAASSGGSSGGGDGSAGVPVDLNGDGSIDSSEKDAAKDKQLALNTDAERKSTEDKLGTPKTDPTKVGALDASDTNNGLSTPVLLAIIALALLAVAAGTILVGRRNPAFAQALRRIPTPSVPIPKRFRR